MQVRITFTVGLNSKYSQVGEVSRDIARIKEVENALDMIPIENNKFKSFLSSLTSIRETEKEFSGRIEEAEAKCHNRREFTSIDSMSPKTVHIDSIQPGGNVNKFS